jgi:hypothetical protein
MSAREIYENSIRQLPAKDRLRLASLILDELANSSASELDISDNWTEQDVADLAIASTKYADRANPAEDADA